jgi:probable rRNA maturation factor
MSIELDLQIASTADYLPTIIQFQSWVNAVLSNYQANSELTIRIVDEEESAILNSKYRNKSGPTNVLSFPADIPSKFDCPLLGDIIICAPVIAYQAREYNKDLMAHWAHIVVHGVLHLLGYSHYTEQEANKMEALEISALAKFGYPSPYGEK